MTLNGGAAVSRHVAVSPSGRFFTAVSLDAAAPQVHLWDSGKPLFMYALPHGIPENCHVKVMDDSRIFLWPSVASQYPALLLEQGRISARGQLLEGGRSVLAPDGTAMIAAHRGTFDYGTVTSKDGQLGLANRYTAAGEISVTAGAGYTVDAAAFAQGRVMTDNGTVYDQHGVSVHHRNWWHNTLAPGGFYTFELQGKRALIFSPVTRARWSFATPGRVWGGDATATGHYALAWFTPDAPDALQPWHNVMLPFNPNSSVLALYEKPGHLRAMLRVEIEKWWPQPLPPEEWWYPSPDGHSIAFNIASGNVSQCLLFRW